MMRPVIDMLREKDATPRLPLAPYRFWSQLIVQERKQIAVPERAHIQAHGCPVGQT
jgi:hypothetical protein